MAFAHNFFLQALAEYGIPGFVLILAMVGMIIWTGYLLVRTKKWPLASGVLAAVIGTLIHQQVDNTIHGANLAGAFWFLCGFLLAQMQPTERTPISVNQNSQFTIVLPIIRNKQTYYAKIVGLHDY